MTRGFLISVVIRGSVPLGSWRALAVGSEAKSSQLHDCWGLGLYTTLKEMWTALTWLKYPSGGH